MLFSPATNNLLQQRGQRVTFHDRQFVVREGDYADAMFVVESGQLEVVIGRQVVAVLQRGDFFGEYAMLNDDRTRTASVQACMVCNLVQVTEQLFDEMFGLAGDFEETLTNRHDFYVFADSMHRLHADWVQEQTSMWVLEDPTRSMPEEIGVLISEVGTQIVQVIQVDTRQDVFATCDLFRWRWRQIRDVAPIPGTEAEDLMLLSISLHDQTIFEFEHEDTREIASAMDEWVASTRPSQMPRGPDPSGHVPQNNAPPDASWDAGPIEDGHIPPSEYEAYLHSDPMESLPCSDQDQLGIIFLDEEVRVVQVPPMFSGSTILDPSLPILASFYFTEILDVDVDLTESILVPDNMWGLLFFETADGWYGLTVWDATAVAEDLRQRLGSTSADSLNDQFAHNDQYDPYVFPNQEFENGVFNNRDPYGLGFNSRMDPYGLGFNSKMEMYGQFPGDPYSIDMMGDGYAPPQHLYGEHDQYQQQMYQAEFEDEDLHSSRHRVDPQQEAQAKIDQIKKHQEELALLKKQLSQVKSGTNSSKSPLDRVNSSLATKIMLTQKSATATKLQKKLLSQKSSEKLLKMLQDKEKEEEKKKPSRSTEDTGKQKQKSDAKNDSDKDKPPKQEDNKDKSKKEKDKDKGKDKDKDKGKGKHTADDGLTDTERQDVEGMSSKEKKAYLALQTEEGRKAFAALHSDEKKYSMGLNEQERSVYLTLTVGDRKLLTNLSTKEKHQCLQTESPDLYLKMQSADERKFFCKLDNNHDRSAFAQLNNNHRAAAQKLTDQDLKAFLKLEESECDGFIEMSAEERAQFIEMTGEGALDALGMDEETMALIQQMMEEEEKRLNEALQENAESVMGVDEEEEEKKAKEKAKEKDKAKHTTFGWGHKPKKEDLDLEAKEIEEATGYIIIKHLGAGSFGTVKLCEHKKTKKKGGNKKGVDTADRFAMKIFKKDVLKKQRQMKISATGKRTFVSALDKVYTEIAIMKELNHPNLCGLIDSFDDDGVGKVIMVLQFIHFGESMAFDPTIKRYRARTPKRLGGVVVRDGCPVFHESKVRTFLTDLVAAMVYLKEHLVAHRDIKPENILVGKDGRLVLADFGVSQQFKEEERTASGGFSVSDTEGTYHYLAPECTTGDKFDPFTADYWAVGVTLFNFLIGKLPFWSDEGGLPALFAKITECKVENISWASNEANHLLRCFFYREPEKRIKLEAILDHPFVTQKDLADYKQ